ncbi:hypothetical protein Bbelb_445080 [Branchiostoma belcheri]|nr:hypothetical protein Bbelb_445080 [Branchiostoma belcheri]
MSQRARFCQRREALQKLQHRARRLPDDIVSKPRSVVQRDDELQIKDSPSPDPSPVFPTSAVTPTVTVMDLPQSVGPSRGGRRRRGGGEESHLRGGGGPICEEEEDAICGEEEEEETICGEKDADCEKEEDAICGEEEDADCEEEEDAICGEKDAICEEEDANCGEGKDANCGEEKDANCGEEEDAICGEEDANCGEEDASFDDVDLESLSSNQSEYIRGKKRGTSRKTKWWRKLCCWLRQEDTDDELE